MKKIYFFVCVVVVFFTTSNSTAQTNVTSSGISIQGIARDVNNEALANIDQLDLNFQIYYFIGASTTPTNILTAIATIKTDNFGVFSYVLNISRDQSNLISTQSAYLKVSSGSVVFSDEKLQTVPYAMYAQNGVPTGTIVAFIGTVAPNGWLLCDGAAIPSGAFYDNLKAMVGNNAPDLRGQFLRGTGSVTGFTGKTGPALKAVQEDLVLGHNHGRGTLTTVANGIHNHNPGSGGYFYALKKDGTGTATGFDSNNGGTEPTINVAQPIADSASHSHTITGVTDGYGGDENRPINYGVNYIIKI